MKTRLLSAQNLSFYICCFFMYSLVGWLYEVFLEVVVYRWGFTNRGVLLGPYLPVYGFGAIAFVLTVYRLIQNKPAKTKIIIIPVVFLGCALIATLIELLTSYALEAIMGSWPWQTYARDYAIQFQGRVALSPSIRFGLGGAVFLYILQPLFERLFDTKHTIKAAIIIICVMSVELVLLFVR